MNLLILEIAKKGEDRMKLTKFPLITMSVFSFLLLFTSMHAQVQAEELPSYVKWGRIAMTKVQEKYPGSEITDYLHVGKEDKEGTSTEKFKLIIKQDQKEIGVNVSLTFDTRTERLLSVDLTETQP